MKHRHTRKPESSKRKKFGGGGAKRVKRREPVESAQSVAERRAPQRERTQVVGVVAREPFGWTLLPTDRRVKDDYIIRGATSAEEAVGELVVAQILDSSKNGRREIVITERLGQVDDPRTVSLIAIHTHKIPCEFSAEAVAEAEAARPVPLGNRTDLRKLPLVTIDGADARDFDDAVFAEPDPKTGGWHLVVAIADVAHYVRSGHPLDLTAYERGNSVYFPDRVVPMLPEALSNELCSLKPKVERACMAVHLWLDKQGELTRWEFVRGLMRSVARLTYEQVQAAMDGKPDATTAPILDTVIKPLYGAYRVLIAARTRRGTLELDLPERKVELGEDGLIKAITRRERLDSHKLIEEFMISANVAAAAQLEGKGGLCLYRVHDKPNDVKLTSLREFLDSIGISLVPSKQLHPRLLTQVLERAALTPHAQVVNEVMLRSQAQAIYSTENIGHFGLALGQYAHFTSPIRRYADLMVHRALIRVGKLGDDSLSDAEVKALPDVAEHISMTERRAVAAERDVVDRFTALFLADKVGEVFEARISGVAKFGLFARLNDSGAEGIIPFNALPNDFYHYDEARQALVGQRSNKVFQLAQAVKVKLDRADRLTGSMSFSIVEENAPPKRALKSRVPRRVEAAAPAKAVAPPARHKKPSFRKPKKQDKPAKASASTIKGGDAVPKKRPR